ncbi:hypothetical protein, partial [Streptomyces sp. SID7909]|uniref:hypothetical protein n=1 Tax=Streptomyces sp. SID7909 TaxID=2706092 RepID=UPI0013B98681
MPFEDPTTELPADAIIGQIPGSKIDGPFDGAKLTPGTVQLDRLEQAIMNVLGQKWWDFGDSVDKWRLQGASASKSGAS